MYLCLTTQELGLPAKDRRATVCRQWTLLLRQNYDGLWWCE